MKLFKYLYYRIYEWDLNTWGPKHRPQWRALFGVSSVMALNILTIVMISDAFGLTNFISSKNWHIEVIFFGFILWGINGMWSVNNDKYKRIVEYYEEEPKAKRRRNTILLWLYVIITFVAPWIIGILHKQYMG